MTMTAPDRLQLSTLNRKATTRASQATTTNEAGCNPNRAPMTGAIDRLLADSALRGKMADESVRIQARQGTVVAAEAIARVAG